MRSLQVASHYAQRIIRFSDLRDEKGTFKKQTEVESGGQVTPKFGCEVTQNGADSLWLSDPGFWWLRDLGTDKRGFCFGIKISRT